MIPRVICRNGLQSYCIKKNNKLILRFLHRSEILDGENRDSYKQSNEQKLKSLLDSSTSFVETKPQNEEDKWATLPYAQGTTLTKRTRDDLDIQRPKIDPRDTSIMLFPGQMAQFIGMAKSLEAVPSARDLFDYASEILKYDLLELCNKGPKKTLNDIRYSHVAVMTASLANVELLREERPNAVLNCVATAGFGVGEITALVFAGAMQFDQALYFLQVRAEAILAAAELSNGGMVKIKFGADARVIEACKQAKEWCIKNNIDNPECSISNFMHPGFKVLSGNEEALQYLEENQEKYRLRSIKRIQSALPLHCKLMEPTVEPIKTALNTMNISNPLIPVYSNITGKPYFTAKQIQKLLPLQLVKPVRWEQTMHNLYARRRGNYFPRTMLCGPGVGLRRILGVVNSKACRESIHIGDVRR